jgi:lipoyl(octanoyl) transferase
MEVRRLGRLGYAEAWALQKELVAARVEGRIPDTLLLLEHDPVVTCGGTAKLPGPLPIPVYQVERGGDATWHGPGQLVGYPILNLAENGLKVREYLRFLERALIEACGLGETLAGFTGVWAKGKKIASIGVAVRRGVSYHGFALNVDCDLAGFRLIHPCKLQPEEIGTLAAALGRPVDRAELEERIVEAFERRLSGVPA